jgi:hypothetical protein
MRGVLRYYVKKDGEKLPVTLADITLSDKYQLRKDKKPFLRYDNQD